jgi:hypothetical protein
MSDATKGLESINRSLTEHERDLILWLLDHPEEDQHDISKLKSQIDALTVVQKCTCGCPTVYFALEGVPVPRKGEHLISDYLATVEGDEVGVMLFQNNRRLSSLEVYSAAGTDKLFGLPAIEDVCSSQELSKRRANPNP